MTRNQFNQHRQDTLKAVCNIVDDYHWFSAPPYKLVINELNKQGIKSSWGNYWTMPSLCMFLNRMGYVGLHGVKRRGKRRHTRT
jgi:hypothetical protein